MRDRILAATAACFTLVAALSCAVPTRAEAAGQKVAIIVGPTAITDSHYYPWAQDTAAAAAAAGATVDLRYCPTPEAARAAANGANIIVYYGHGNGYPNPYSATLLSDRTNGWGLRDPAKSWSGTSCTDSVLRYYGEDYLTGRITGNGFNGAITPAPGFVMIYSNACYAPGASEPGHPNATFDEARARVGYYSRGVLGMGAGAYYATDLWQGAATLVTQILSHPNKSFGDIFKAERQFAASALSEMDHPNVAGDRLWLHRSANYAGDLDYWYAFAGDPNATPASPGGAPIATRIDLTRLAGPDRYATAAALSAASFAPGVAVAYVAIGDNFPDALAGGPVAARNGGPMLLVERYAVPQSTAAELGRLRPQRIVVLGSSGVIDDTVAGQLAAYQTGGGVARIAGADRYATAAAVSASTFAPGAPVAYIATGLNFPDALAGGAASALRGGPVLLVDGGIPEATAVELARLQPGRIIVLGSAAAVSDEVAAGLAGYTAGAVTRLAGPDRYTTAVAVSADAHPGGARVAYVATGFNFPDALAGVPVAGRAAGPLLLVPGTSLPDAVRAELLRLDPEAVVILGGPSVVSEQVANEIRALFPLN